MELVLNEGSDLEDFLLCLDSSYFAVATEKGIRYDSMDYLSDKYTSQAF